jgi:hypothetical protein
MRLFRFLGAALLLACAPGAANGQTSLPDSGFTQVKQPVPVVEPRLRYRFYATYQSLFPAELEHGGSAGSERIEFRAGVTWRPTPEFAAGVALHYDLQEWVFESGGAFGSAPPWDALERGVATFPVELVFAPPFGAQVSPFVEWSYEREAGASDAMSYGTRVAALGVWGPRHRVGVGVTVHRQFFETHGAVFWLVDWELTPGLRLLNSVASGPFGPEGLELCWSLPPEWEVAVGGVGRSDRYRLEPEGMPAGDVAETGGVPTYARVAWGVGRRVRADLYGGMVAEARLKRWGSDGEEWVNEDIRSQPVLAMVVSSYW